MINTQQTFDPLAILKSVGVGPTTRVADFGCGHGHFVFPAAKLVGERGSVFAIDLQHELLLAIESRAKTEGLMNIKTIWADLEKIGSTKIPDESVDIVLLVNNHIDSMAQQKMLREAVRIAKSGGAILIIDWLGGNTIPLAPAVTERVAKEAAIVNAQGAGLFFVDEFSPSRYHYGLIFHK